MLDAMAAISGILIFLVSAFFIILIILGFLIPFFIFRIRNEIINVNKNLAEIIDLMKQSHPLDKTLRERPKEIVREFPE